MLFDEVGGWLQSTIETASQRTADTFRNSKSYLERTKLRSQLDEAYRALGKAEYEAAIVGVENMNNIHALISEIKQLRQSLDEIERNLNKNTPVASAPPQPVQQPVYQQTPPPAPAAGSVTYCSKCGKQNPSDSAFCNGCGAQLLK